MYNGSRSFGGTVAMGGTHFTSRKKYLSRHYMYNDPELFDGTVAMGTGIVLNAQKRFFFFLLEYRVENQSENI